MNNLSVVISAYNEEEKIEDCLKSVKFADEIIFIDNSSIDKTSQIAKKYTTKIFQRENNPMLNINKNYGFGKAKNEWILSLDADERVTPELKDEILRAIKKNEREIAGYFIPRKNIIFGKWIKHTGWYPDYQLRLFKKEKGKFPALHVHEMIKVDGKEEYLKSDLDHLNYESISHFLKKLDTYTSNEAERLISGGYVFLWKDAIRMPVKEFLSRFFLRKGYKDGIHGLTLSILMAFYHFIVFAKIWEQRKFASVEVDDFLSETGKEIGKASKDIKFWIAKEKVSEEKNPLLKFIKKLS